MEKRRIIDAHHHLWDLGACHYPWLMERGVPRFFGNPEPIQRNYLASELRADASDFELAGSVHIQVGVAPGDEVRESEWLSKSAVLDRHAAFSRVRGIRHIVGRSAEEDKATGSDALLDDATWLRNLASLRERNFSFDLQLIPQQVNRVADVLETVPGLRVALCHCGSPWDQTAAGLESWRSGLQRLAALPDVYCKISGLSMFNHDWSIEELRPIVSSCIDIFGPERCMFGSNFPVDKLHKTYRDIWHAYEALTGQYSSQEQAAMFANTAESFYRLG
jgi:predicted TIM-barrel fold metal-dependent hydrolase